MRKEEFFKIARGLSKEFPTIPIIWDGRRSVLAMKEADFPHWKQMEWIGWYFQFLCEGILKKAVAIP